MKKLLSLLLAAAFFLGTAIPGASAAIPAFRESGIPGIAKPAPEEVSAWFTNPSGVSRMFEEEPVTVGPGYAPGKLTEEARNHALDTLNFARRLAGLGPVGIVSWADDAQYGAVVNAANDMLSHFPEKPADMEEAFFQKGKQITSSSNLCMYGRFFNGILAASIWSFMDDSDSSNIDRLGHRRWQLNPAMGQTAFGCARSRTGSGYVAEYSFDRSAQVPDFDFISWPASGRFPANQFPGNCAWSISLNPNRYQTPVLSELKVILSNGTDCWEFLGTQPGSDENGTRFFHLDTGGYGIPNCIIFRPDGVKKYEGTYTVCVEGLKDSSGKPVDFSYQVDFYDIFDPQYHRHVYQKTVVAPTCTQEGYDLLHCACGNETRENIVPALGHDWNDGVITREPTETGKGIRTFVCTRCGAIKTEEIPAHPSVNLPFDDVPRNQWYRPYVEYVYRTGLMTGHSTKNFGPEEQLTRAQLAQILYNREGNPDVPADGIFADVKRGSWFFDAVTWAAGKGYVGGYGNGLFGPKDPITREQLATILWRCAGKPETSGSLEGFVDADRASDYARTPLCWAVERNIVNGKGNNDLDPAGNATRAEVAKMIMCYVEQEEKTR